MKNYDENKIKNDFDAWWNDFGSSITPSPNDDMESHAKKVAELAWSESLMLFGADEYKTTQNEIDFALDQVLKASGSALKHYSEHYSLARMRGEMLAIMKRSYVDGSNACHRAMTTK